MNASFAESLYLQADAKRPFASHSIGKTLAHSEKRDFLQGERMYGIQEHNRAKGWRQDELAKPNGGA